MKYHPRTRKLAKWLYQFIDRYNYGVTTADGPSYRYKADTLEGAFLTKCFKGIHKLSMTDIEDHLFAGTIHFYTSRRASDIHLVKLDIDAKEAHQDDAHELAAWIVTSYFPGAYWEPSTHLRGAHIYILVDVRFQKRKSLKEMMVEAENSFKAIVKEKIKGEGWRAILCSICGLNRKDGGVLGKIPRPQSDQALDQLLNSKVFSTYDLAQAVIARREAVGEEVGTEERGEKGSALASVRTTEGEHVAKRETGSPYYVNELRSQPDAWKRSLGAAMVLARSLGRLPELDELENFYVFNGLNTGEAKRDRNKRLQRAIDFIAKTWDPSRLAKPHNYKVGEYVEKLKNLLTVEDLNQCCTEANFEREITYQDLDVCLGCHVEQVATTSSLYVNHLRSRYSPDLLFTVPVDAVIAWFAKLKGLTLHDKLANKPKVLAMRLALLKANMITKIDDTYVWGRGNKKNGIAKKWGLGVNCAQYQVFASMLEHQEITSGPGLISSSTI